MSEQRPTGLTKTQGWEIGVRRTVALSPEQAWEWLITPPGLDAWFGEDDDFSFAKGAAFRTEAGVTGEIVSYEDGQLIRMRWQPRGWEKPSTLQVRVNPASSPDKAVISFHHEHLPDGETREAMQKQWSAVLDDVTAQGEES